MFEIHIEGPGRVRLKGRLDASRADEALQALSGLTGPTVIDCTGLDYISSAGLGVLVETFKRLRQAGHSLRLVDVTPRVKSVFRLANLDTVMNIE